MPARLPLRDAALVNGILVHGLDFDDTHSGGVIHATASVLPTVLAVGAQQRASGREMLAAYVLGVEVAARLGAVAKGAFHQVGFHPTGLIGAFACALAAGRLMGLEREATRHGARTDLVGGLRQPRIPGGWRLEQALPSGLGGGRRNYRGGTRPAGLRRREARL